MSKSTNKRKLQENAEPPRKKRKENIDDNNIQPVWQDYELLHDLNNISEDIAKNVIKLFNEGDTIPFIARYRKHITNNLSADELRIIKKSYEDINQLKKHIQTVYKLICKSDNDSIKHSVLTVRDEETLNEIHALFKPETSKSLLKQATDHGLEEPALNILNNQWTDLGPFRNSDKFKNLEDVKKGIIYILAKKIATSPELLELLHKLKMETRFVIQSKRIQKRSNSAKADHKEDESKFQNYFDFEIPLKYIKSHQILAVYRGEKLKILSVKIDIPDYFYKKYKYFCYTMWKDKLLDKRCANIVYDSIEDCFKRLISPMVKKQLRADLKLKAEQASIEVFGSNLKQILLAPPIRNQTIMAIDPGFVHGCKIGVISSNGTVLDTCVIYPHTKAKSETNDKEKIKDLLLKYNCNIIGIGNGTACRETESFITSLIKEDYFKPIKISYLIVNECGASIYSCSQEATKEFPDMDPNLISAVSLARRMQDPLSELVKVEPKHLGVGMYQHDVKEKQLEEVLDDIVSECVSFVGVDLNTTSQCLLRHIAGLSEKKASAIIEYRQQKGEFKYREELLNVPSIGANTFKQCAGFLKVINARNKLDNTTVHPESYDVAKDILKQLNLNLKDIGQEDFINSIKTFNNFDQICRKYSILGDNVRSILESLSQPLNYDLRVEDGKKPLFKDGLTNINDLKVGCVLTGGVENVTHFGCFVDIGVGISGLIHQSKMKNTTLKIGDHVEVKVVNVEIQRKRIGLELLTRL